MPVLEVILLLFSYFLFIAQQMSMTQPRLEKAGLETQRGGGCQQFAEQ
jgi:hypothetical protein